MRKFKKLLSKFKLGVKLSKDWRLKLGVASDMRKKINQYKLK